MHHFVTLVFMLFLAVFAGSVAAEMSPLELEELNNDCKTEGDAKGMSGTDLEEYIYDCIYDFTGAEMTNTEVGAPVE